MSNGLTPENYVDVFQQLEAAQARYVVIGGAAVVLHGHVRPIADLDIVVDPAPDETLRAMNVLTACGFAPSIPLPMSMMTVQRLFDYAAREIDVFVRYHIPFEELWSDSERVSCGDGLVRIVSLNHLIWRRHPNTNPQRIHDSEMLQEFAKLRDQIRDAPKDSAVEIDSE
ncbi:MAG TPA: hypothetical protein VIW80_04180 [Pyrinomonadaceae bacterium]|jgi:hypothetical protein